MWPLEQSHLTFQAGSPALSTEASCKLRSLLLHWHPRLWAPCLHMHGGLRLPRLPPLGRPPSLVPTISTAPAFFTDRWECQCPPQRPQLLPFSRALASYAAPGFRLNSATVTHWPYLCTRAQALRRRAQFIHLQPLTQLRRPPLENFPFQGLSVFTLS